MPKKTVSKPAEANTAEPAKKTRTVNPAKRLFSIVTEVGGEFSRTMRLAPTRRHLDTSGLEVVQVKDVTDRYPIDLELLATILTKGGYSEDETAIVCTVVRDGYANAVFAMSPAADVKTTLDPES